jgi:hypothetical protein
MRVIQSSPGRLANQLLIFAHFAANAMKHGYALTIPGLLNYASSLEFGHRLVWDPMSLRNGEPGDIEAEPRGDDGGHSMRWPIGWFGGDRDMTQDCDLDGDEFQSVRQRYEVLVARGWCFRDYRNLPRFAPEIRRLLRPSAGCRSRAESVIGKARAATDFLVGVHVRHGDFRYWNGGKHFFPISTYVRWMHELVDARPGTGFIICSDEARSPNEFAPLTVWKGPGGPMDDLYALSRCDFILAPASTFSTWASFYGGAPLLQRYRETDVADASRASVAVL